MSREKQVAMWEDTSLIFSELSDNRDSHAHGGEPDAMVDWGAAMLNSVMPDT